MKLIELRKLCLPGTIRNPYTKRCNRMCENGYERITNSKRKTIRCYKKCTRRQYRNQNTNRCKKTIKKMPKHSEISKMEKKDKKHSKNKKSKIKLEDFYIINSENHIESL
jgi:hypothetical protein